MRVDLRFSEFTGYVRTLESLLATTIASTGPRLPLVRRQISTSVNRQNIVPPQ